MPPRAIWKGHVRLSLVSFAVRIHNATSTASKVSFNQLHADCHQRLKTRLHCPEHGEIERSDVVKGYEYEKGKYVVMDDEDFTKVRLESTKTIELVQFIDEGELDLVYLNSPYYLAPDGPVSDEAFRVIREAMKKTGRIGIGRVVLSGREHMIAMTVEGEGMKMTTLRYPREVRKPEPYFNEIRQGEIPDDQLDLAIDLIERNTSPFAPDEFEDRYQDALLDVVKMKIEGEEPVVVQEVEVAKTLNFMDALKQSLGQESSSTAKVSEKKGTPKAKGKSKSKTKTKKKPPAKSIGDTEAATSKRKKKKA